MFAKILLIYLGLYSGWLFAANVQSNPQEEVMSWLGADPRPHGQALKGVQERELRKAFQKIETSETSLDRQEAESDIADTCIKILRSEGYVVSESDFDLKTNVLFFEVKSAPEGTLAAKLLQNLQHEGMHLQIGGLSNFGTMFYDTKIIRISPYHVFLGKDIISTTVIHESIHFVIDRNISEGIASPFDAEIRNAKSDRMATVTDIPIYPSFFSFQELATHLNDVYLLKQGYPSAEAVGEGQTLEKVLEIKSRNLPLMKSEIVTVTDNVLKLVQDDDFFAKLDFAEDPNHKGVIAVAVPYQARSGADALLLVLLPELKPKTLKEYDPKILREALIAKLKLMHDYALNCPDLLVKSKRLPVK